MELGILALPGSTWLTIEVPAMPKFTETHWKARLRKELAKFGPVLSLHGHAMQEPGWPDLYVSSRRWSGFIELKMAGGQLSTAQKIVGRKLESNGAFIVLRYVDERFANIESSDGGIYRVTTWTNAEFLLSNVADAIRSRDTQEG